MPNVNEDNMGVLYEHWRTDTNECFYVGISWANENTRPHDLTPRNPYHGNIVAKLKENNFEVDVRIQAWDLNKEELCELEIMQIAYWRDLIGNRLTNISQGGEGLREWTEEMKQSARDTSLSLWRNKEYKNQQIKSRNKKELIEKKSLLASQQWENEEIRQKRIESLLSHNKTPEGKNLRKIAGKKASVSLKEFFKTKKGIERAKASSEINKKLNQNEDFAKRMKEAKNTPQAKKNYSEAALKRWASKTEEERRTIGKKGAETRRKNREKND